MKTKILATVIFLTFLFFQLSGLSQAQWGYQYPVPTDKNLEDVFFIDDLNGWAVGELGTILYTSDGGITWSLQSSGTNLRLQSVVFTDSQTGWIVGGNKYFSSDYYIILHTNNGGNNWIEQDSGSTTNLMSLFFFDSDNGWAVGDHNYILHTNDGGNNWSIQQSGSGYSDMREVYFTSLSDGWAASNSGLWRTTDGGMDWDVFIPGSFESIYFLDLNEAWVSGNIGVIMGQAGILLHTTDGFSTWDTIKYCGAGENQYCGYYSIYFKDSNSGWMLHYDCYFGGWSGGGCSYDLIKTEDGGETWENVESLASGGALYFTADGKGCIVGNHGTILTSINWSDQWNLNSRGGYNCFYSIDFSDNSNGWAAGAQGYHYSMGGYGSTIVYTDDGGNTWVEQNNPNTGPIESIFSINSDTCWAVSSTQWYGTDTAYLIHTTNGGSDWFIQKWDIGIDYKTVYFINGTIGWIAGGHSDNSGYSEGRIYKTIDGGNTWSQQECDTLECVNSIFFVDSDIGWAVGNSIYKTTDGGLNWTEQFYDTTGFDLESVYFNDSENGWIVGGNHPSKGIILNTIDGGSNWSSEIFNNKLFSVNFKNDESGLISGSNGTILITHDGGITWELQDSGTDNDLYSICYTNSGSGFSAGMWGTILHSSPVTTSDREYMNSNNTIVDLQCFPNPFSESTTLSYSLQQKSIVSIEIYNNHGQSVFKQKEEIKSEGQHVIIFGRQNLPTGIYFCVLKTDEKTQTTKIIKH